MEEEGQKTALVMGVIGIIAIAGLVFLFKGATAQVSYGPGPFIEESANRLCGQMACENGLGAVVIGEYQDFWVCGCPANFADQKIADWSNQWKGDEAQDGLVFPNQDNAFLIRKFREY